MHMQHVVPNRNWRFGRTDRIVLKNRTYRYVGRKDGTHILQQVNGDFIENDFVLLSNKQITSHIQAGSLRYDRDHFSRQMRMLRARFDTSRIDDLEPVARMALLWRYEWVRQTRELIGMKGNRDVPKIERSGPGMDRAIDFLLVRMRAWYEEQFRDLIPELRVRDVPHLPSGSTLYSWILRYEEAGCRIEGLRDGRENSGRGNQLHPDVVRIIEQEVEGFRSRTAPTKAEIVRRVHEKIWKLNKESGTTHPTTSARIISERLRKLEPFGVDAARHGADQAIARHAGVGRGAVVDAMLQRVEMDDWEFDLHVLLCTAGDYRAATAKERRKIERVRPTATVAIDAFTRTIVGFNLSPYPPSSASSIACLRSICIDKTSHAFEAGCDLDLANQVAYARYREGEIAQGKEPLPYSPNRPFDPGWAMFGRPESIVTDGGPAFDSAFDDVARALSADRSIPEKDPRLRGRIERFFKTLRDAILQNFSGRTFSNPTEKGSYDSEANASVTFEELRGFCIRWIVDVYHRTPHSGLAGRTPVNYWSDAERYDWVGTTAFSTPEEVRYAFAVRLPRKPTPEGLRLFNLHYRSPEIDRFRIETGSTKLMCRVDPEDITSIFVDIPTHIRNRPGYRNGPGYVEVPVVATQLEQIRKDRTLAHWVETQAIMREIVAEEDEAQRPIRIKARDDLYTGGRDAMIRAGVLQLHHVSEEMLKRFQDRLDRKIRNASQNPADRKRTNADPDGRLIAEVADEATGSRKGKGAGRTGAGPKKNAAKTGAGKASGSKPRKDRKNSGYEPKFERDGGGDVGDITLE